MKDKKVLVVDDFGLKEIPNLYFLRFFIKYDDDKVARFLSHFEKDLESGYIGVLSNECEIYPIGLSLKDNPKNKFFSIKYDDDKIAGFFSHSEKDLESIYPIGLPLKDNLKNKFFSDLNIDLCSSDEREKAVEKFKRTMEIVDFLENFDFLELLKDLIEEDYK